MQATTSGLSPIWPQIPKNWLPLVLKIERKKKKNNPSTQDRMYLCLNKYTVLKHPYLDSLKLVLTQNTSILVFSKHIEVRLQEATFQ
jgi:hypothetical protein